MNIANLIRGNDRGAISLRVLLSLVLVIASAALGGLGFSPAASAAGASGTVKVDDESLDGTDNNPHRACAIKINWDGFPVGTYTSTVTFTQQGGPGGGTLIASSPPSAPATETVTIAAPGDSHTKTYSLTTTGLPLTPQGYHININVSVDGAGGNVYSKSKVIFAAVCDLAVSVVKTNDADGNGTFTTAETDTGPSLDVPFKAVIKNIGDTPFVIDSITDEWLGHGPAAVACSPAIATTLAPNAETTCYWTEPSYSPAAGTSLVNTARVNVKQASNFARVASANSSSTVSVAALVPDLRLTKSGSADSTVGTSGWFTIDVQNIGTGVAAGTFTVTDDMPAGVVATAASSSPNGDWSCVITNSGDDVSCDHAGSLVAGASAEQITISVDWTSVGTKNNSATVSTVGAEPTANNTDDDQVVIAAALTPDLKLTKSGPATRTTGQTGDYTLVVENVGTAAATSLITVTDTLPAGVTVVGPVTSGGFACTVAANVVTCTTNDDIAVGAANAKTITLPATFATVGNKANTGTVSVTGDGNATNNTSVFNTSVVDPIIPPPPTPLAADLAVKKTGPASVTPGGTATWTLTVTNKGPGNASGFSVTDTLPAGVTLSSLSGTNFTCTAATLVCTFTSVLLPTQTAVVTVVGDVSSAISGTSIANVVVVGPTDATPADNTDTLVSAIDRPAAPADLVLEKAGPAVAVAGEQITWTITVTNAGGQDATGFTVGDPLATGVSLVSGAGDEWFCTTNLPLACVFPGTLAPGETAALEVTGLVDAGYDATSITNTASVPLTNDPTPENNSDSVTVPVAVPIEGGEEEPATGSPSPSPLPDLPFVPEEEMPEALPFTGSSTDQLLGVGALLSLLGLMLIVTGRRRRTVG